MRCEEIMTRNPTTLQPNATVVDAARLMAKEDIGFIPVVDQSGNVQGVITDRDIVVKGLAKNGDITRIQLTQLMETNVACCAPQDDTEEVRRKMDERQIQRMLVCEGKRPVGVISLQNLTRDAGLGGTVRAVKEGTSARLQ
ncbi:MAG TPA: CBS domain-containing protein [Myxococcales bacterium]|jgi:CBS domain-containing protein